MRYRELRAIKFLRSHRQGAIWMAASEASKDLAHAIRTVGGSTTTE